MRDERGGIWRLGGGGCANVYVWFLYLIHRCFYINISCSFWPPINSWKLISESIPYQFHHNQSVTKWRISWLSICYEIYIAYNFCATIQSPRAILSLFSCNKLLYTNFEQTFTKSSNMYNRWSLNNYHSTVSWNQLDFTASFPKYAASS